jgi:2-polyprenyl-3-methyl-5-hydroxy-6-metoxy-1,4-benzoquinol methylase
VGVSPIYSKNCCSHLNVIFNELCKAWRKELRSAVKVQLCIGVHRHTTVISDGYLWNIPEYREILLDYSNVCYVERFSDFKSKIILNDISLDVEDIGIENVCNLIFETIKKNAIRRIIPLYHWYQEFDFLPILSDSRSIKKFNALNLPQNMNECRVLDVGCNTGFFSVECDKRGAEVIGIDILDKFIDLANIIKNSIYFTKKTRFYVMDINDDVSQLGIFSHVLVLSMFHYINNQEEIIKKLMNVLKQDGVLKLELGIFQEETNELKVINNKYYPTKLKLEEMLQDYTYVIDASVNQAGDDIPRFVLSISKKEK